MKNKVIDYFQLTFCLLVVIFINKLWVNSNLPMTIATIPKMLIMVAFTVGGIILLREIKFLKPKDTPMCRKWGVGIYVVAIIFATLLSILLCYGINLVFPVITVMLMILFVFLAGLIHPRYSVAITLVIAWMVSTNMENYSSMLANYFYALKFLLVVTLISYVTKLIFLTRWSNFFKKET